MWRDLIQVQIAVCTNKPCSYTGIVCLKLLLTVHAMEEAIVAEFKGIPNEEVINF